MSSNGFTCAVLNDGSLKCFGQIIKGSSALGRICHLLEIFRRRRTSARGARQQIYRWVVNMRAPHWTTAP